MAGTSSRRISRREFGQAGLAVLGGATLAACAPGAAPAKPGAAGAPSTGQAASGYVPNRAVKVGILVPQSGVFASTGNWNLPGMKLAMREFEDKGWRFEPIVEDEKIEPAPNIRALQKLVERDHVDCVLGPVSSAVLPALRDPVDQAKIVMSTVQAATRDITGSRCSRYIFRTTPTNYMQSIGFGPWVYKNLGKRAYVITADYTAGHEIADGMVEGFTREGGEVIAYVKVPLATTDFAPFMGPILDARPDLVMGFFAAKNAVDIVKAFYQFGVKDRFKLAFHGSLTSNDLIETQGQAETEGIYEYLNFSESLDTPEFQEWARRLQAMFPEIVRIPLFCMHGYTATKAVLLGIEQARSLKSDDIAAAMEQVEFVGPAGPIAFGPSHQATLNFYITQVRSLQHIVLDRLPAQKDPNEGECRRTW
jgi:branched-chain amino acid transport system substrate-binding protein